MKKAIVLAIITLFLVPSAALAEFSDISEKDDETQRAINLLAEKRYITGRTETEFDPDSSISRAEFAAVVLRLLDKLDTVRPYYLNDVPKSCWYYYTAGSAAEYGIMSGFEDGSFRGGEPIQRAQAVTIASRVLTSNAEASPDGAVLNFSDDVPSWADEYVRTAVNAGIISGDGIFDAGGAITRGEAAVILARLYNKISGALSPEGYTGPSEPVKPPITIVIDPGHGKDSGYMSDEEKLASGWLRNDDNGQWGEWRHWAAGTAWEDCRGGDGGSDCWYRMENGDREIEPRINFNNALSAAKYLEEMGYEVRLTRGGDENPSMTKRLIYCYPNNDVSAVPDADLFVCVHSNAGGGRGSAYIELGGEYTQKWIPQDYASRGNTLGRYINDEIIAQTSMKSYGEGKIGGLTNLILFCKSPIPIAYLEIGFFDNSADLDILNSEYDGIGHAIADGINKYCGDYLK